MRDGKRAEILQAAIKLFAKKGFNGTTTRDLAAEAQVNEAIIFRHFKTKQDLYRAILEDRLNRSQDFPCTEVEAHEAADEKKFLELIGRRFLEKHEHDTTFMRLMLFSALEGHELSDMFLTDMASRAPLAKYLKRRMGEGAIRRMDPHLAARAFFGMFVSFVQWQEIFGQKKTQHFASNDVVRSFVSIFLQGVKPGAKAGVKR
jgi:AcrR family transcriptional regulator